MLPQAATKDAFPSARSARWGRWQPEGLTEGVDRLGADTTKPIGDRRYKYNIKYSARSVDLRSTGRDG